MNLKIARQIAQKSQEELAEMVHADPKYLDKLERGGTDRLEYRLAVRIARALNCPPEELFPVTEGPDPVPEGRRRGRPRKAITT